MERPDLVRKVVADSFDGRVLAENFTENLAKERNAARENEQAAGFYEGCQGDDRKVLVDKDTDALLFMGSKGDEMVRKDFLSEYKIIAGLTGAQICVFESGFHPAIVSGGDEAAGVIQRFLD